MLELKEVDDLKLDVGIMLVDILYGGLIDMDISDELVDMDDDFGLSEEEEEDEGSEELDDEFVGLLFLFFKKFELKKFEVEVVFEEFLVEGDGDVEMVDVDFLDVFVLMEEGDFVMLDLKELVFELILIVVEVGELMSGVLVEVLVENL